MPTPGYQTQQHAIAVAGVADLVIRSLLDRQQFHDPLGAAARCGISSAAWPLFGLPWPSGALLAARLALRPVRAGERILEVGCGLALASLVAHRRGADVTASDCHPLAESFLLENLRLNGLLPMKYRHVDWAVPPPAATAGRFDLVIGSDVLYERDDLGRLAACIGAQAAPSAEVWIVDPDRANRPAFTRRMAQLGFGLRQERMDRAATAGRLGYKGRLLIFTRPAARMPGQPPSPPESPMLTAHLAAPFTIELAATPTTGYTWEAADLPEGVKLLDSRFVPPASALPGAGGTRVFEFQAARAGRVSLHFVLRRSWETEPAQRQTVEVDVLAD